MKHNLTTTVARTHQADAGIGSSIVGDLRRLILTGKLTAGSRLPSNQALRKRYGVTGVTVSRAIKQLGADGYLRSVRRSGVFVAQELPHRTRFGVVFHSNPGSATDWTRFSDVIYGEATKGIPGLNCRFVPYLDVRPGVDPTQQQGLAQDIHAHRLGGLFFTFNPWQLFSIPCLQAPPMPRAAIMEPGKRSDMDAVQFLSLLDRALEWLAVQGRRRVAMICSSTVAADAGLPPYLAQTAARYGLELRPQWLQFADIGHPESATHLTHLLLAAAPAERPDGLFIADDNLTGAVEKGILAAGVSVPGDLLVVSHCNFPQPAYTRLPFHRLGYDIRAMLCDVVTRFRGVTADRGATVIMVPPVWEEECLTRWAIASQGLTTT